MLLNALTDFLQQPLEAFAGGSNQQLRSDFSQGLAQEGQPVADVVIVVFALRVPDLADGGRQQGRVDFLFQ